MVTDAEFPGLHAQVPDWEVVDKDGVKRLRRTFRFDSWLGGVSFASKVADLAEREDHHPTLLITWGKVTVTWWTHAIGGLHRNDFIMARQTDMTFESGG